LGDARCQIFAVTSANDFGPGVGSSTPSSYLRVKYKIAPMPIFAPALLIPCGCLVRPRLLKRPHYGPSRHIAFVLAGPHEPGKQASRAPHGVRSGLPLATPS
jgi:hypothetical protein